MTEPQFASRTRTATTIPDAKVTRRQPRPAADRAPSATAEASTGAAPHGRAEVPIVLGGQGRSNADLCASASALALTLLWSALAFVVLWLAAELTRGQP